MAFTLEHFPEFPFPPTMAEVSDVEAYLVNLHRSMHEFFALMPRDIHDGISVVDLDDLANTSLADPGADRIVFWDDSDGQYEFLTANTALTITGNNLDLDHLGIEDLADPGADRIFFWDDGATASKWLAPDGTTIEISGTTLQVITGGLDHGGLTGLGDDDHSLYPLVSNFEVDRATIATNWTDLTDAGATALHKHDHGGMDGLTDDDHTQYILHSLASAANDFIVASGANTYVKKTLAETGTILEGDIEHDNLVGFVANEHIDWTSASADFLTSGTLGCGAITATAGLTINAGQDVICASGVNFKSSADNAGYNFYGSSTINKGAKMAFYGASHATVPGNLYLDYGDYTAAAPAGAKLYIRAMNNSSVTNAIVCDINGTADFGTKMPATDSRCRVYLSADQNNITNGGWRTITFNTESYDTGSDFNTGTHTYVTPVAGYYQISVGVMMHDLVADKQYYLGLEYDGSMVTTHVFTADKAYNTMTMSDIHYFAAAKNVLLKIYHTDVGNTLDINSAEYTHMAIHLLSV